MKLDFRGFTSKVARRAFFIFIACALLPISVLAFISLRQVTSELRTQSERRMRQAAKSTGLLLHQRILALDPSLEPVTPPASPATGPTRPRPFIGVTLVTEDGRSQPVFGEVKSLPVFTAEQQRHVAAGEKLLSTHLSPAGPARFFLTQWRDPKSPAAGTLYGEIDPAYLWTADDEANLEIGTKMILLDERGQVLISSFAPGSTLPDVKALKETAGRFAWDDSGNQYLASYWSLFLKNHFLVPHWTVVLNQETAEVFAPLRVFYRTFVLVALLSLLTVLLLSFGQIRKILQPLARLQDATRRLSLGRLDTRVEVKSGDEFEDLAGSFNQMAGQLGRQFDALTMRSEITVALSRNELPEELLRSCMEIMVRHLNLAVAGVWMIEDSKGHLHLSAVSGPAKLGDGIPDCVPLGFGELGRVAAEGRPFATNMAAGDSRWSNPAWSKQEQLVAFVGHPLIIDGRVQGVAAVFATRPLDVIDLGGIASTAGEIAQGIARRRAAEALYGSEEQVRQLQKMEAVGRLAGGIAHDFNNLLTVIMGYGQILLDGLKPEDPRYRSAQIIEQTAVRAAQLTKQLLAFSRKQHLAPTLLDLSTVVSGMSSILRRLIGESIELVCVGSETPGLVKVDRGQIEQVLVNLVVNARDAMPTGGTITVESGSIVPDLPDLAASAARGQHPYVVLKITDTGTGMDAATQAKIFEPFFTTKAAGKGTGLGLATVFGIVTQSAGIIRVESKLGVGTVFSLYFPLASGVVEEAPAQAAPVARGWETILLVEDEHDVRMLLQDVLEGYGYVVLSAGRPSAALRLAEHHTGPIHLLLTDMVMPEMSGSILAQQLLSRRPEMALLQMSGYTEYQGETETTPANRPAFLQKPFTRETVAREIRAILDLTPVGETTRRT